MNRQLGFETIPFEIDPEFERDFEEEDEWSRRRSFAGGAAGRYSRSHSQTGLRQHGTKRPAVRRPLPTPVRPRGPRAVVFGPYGLVSEPYPGEPEPAGAEYVRWVQSALNDVLGLRLPVDGIMDAATRSAVRSFQQREGLPVDGIVGPDTERALSAARGGKSPQAGATKPSEPGMMEPSEPATTLPEPGMSEPAEPAMTPPAAELDFEWETFGDEFEDDEGIDEADLEWLDSEWKAILPDIVLPELDSTGARPAAGSKVGDHEVGKTLAMAAKKVPGLGITLEELLVRHQAESGGIPIKVLLAFIHFEAGSRLFDDATAGKWNEKYQKYSPSFYELGVFQTPAGTHGCIREGGKKWCKYKAPGHNVERSQFGNRWHRLKGTYPTEDNWKDPTMQVRIGLWDLSSTGERVAKDFPALFPSRRSEWYLRMPVLYSFAQGAGWTRAYLRKYKNELLALPESQRWDFLRGKPAFLKGYKPKTSFDPENVDKKMALAAKLRAVRGATVTQPPATDDRRAGTAVPSPSVGLPASGSRPVLRRGSRGTAVEELQNRLTALGFNSRPADGIFGSQTEEAVKSFQRSRGIAADGIVGTLTWGQLYAQPGTEGGKPSPTPGPSASEPQVTINSNALVSKNAVRVLKDILRAAGLSRATITSGRRTPNDQARIMYDLIEHKGGSYAKNLYGSSGEKVIDVYSAQKSAGNSATAIKQAMEAKINQLGCHNVSHHCSDTHDVIDVAPSSIADQAAFRLALDSALKNGTIDKYIPPPKDPAFHIEIILSPTAGELMSRILRSPPLPLDAFLARGAQFEMD